MPASPSRRRPMAGPIEKRHMNVARTAREAQATGSPLFRLVRSIGKPAVCIEPGTSHSAFINQ